jgi:hypothetical protein
MDAFATEEWITSPLSGSSALLPRNVRRKQEIYRQQPTIAMARVGNTRTTNATNDDETTLAIKMKQDCTCMVRCTSREPKTHNLFATHTP